MVYKYVQKPSYNSTYKNYYIKKRQSIYYTLIILFEVLSDSSSANMLNINWMNINVYGLEILLENMLWRNNESSNWSLHLKN